MGTCGSYPYPDTTNQCDTWGNTYQVPNFCTLEGSAGDGYRNDYGTALGSPGEYIYYGEGESCNYNDCNNVQWIGSCCFSSGGCCGIAGVAAQTKRTAFNGDPLTCCLQDALCTTLGIANPPIIPYPDAGIVPTKWNIDNLPPGQCFSDGGLRNTCDPANRDITSSTPSGDPATPGGPQGSSCQDLVTDYCSGADLEPDDTSWIQRWNSSQPSENGNVVKQSCLYALQRNLFSNAGGDPCSTGLPATALNTTGTCSPAPKIPMSAEGIAWASNLISRVSTKYAENGFTLGAQPGTVEYNSFQELIYSDICCPYPFLCQSALKNSCASVDPQRLSLDPSARSFCGCFLPDENYEQYVDNFQINKECTPLCNRQDTIPLTTGDGTPLSCTQNVCLIDNLTINAINSTISGGINIGNFCGGCQNSTGGDSISCECIISNNTIDTVNAQIFGGINVSEQCGSTRCMVVNPVPGASPAIMSIPCSGGVPKDPFAPGSGSGNISPSQKSRNIKIILILVVMFIVIFVALLIIKPFGSQGIVV